MDMVKGQSIETTANLLKLFQVDSKKVRVLFTTCQPGLFLQSGEELPQGLHVTILMKLSFKSSVVLKKGLKVNPKQSSVV